MVKMLRILEINSTLLLNGVRRCRTAHQRR